MREKVIAVWYNLSTYDNIGSYVSKNAEPVDYTIEVNAALGGSYPSSGWETVQTVTGNDYSSRQHVIDMVGYNWIRMKVDKVNGNGVTLNLDIHDVSKGISDSWIFFGDSITAGGMVNAYGTGYAYTLEIGFSCEYGFVWYVFCAGGLVPAMIGFTCILPCLALNFRN